MVGKTDELQIMTSRVVAGYVTRSFNAKLYHLHEADQKIDAVVVVPLNREIDPHIMVMTRIEGDLVIIETDTTDQPVEEALITAGIPHSQIVFAYAGDAASLA